MLARGQNEAAQAQAAAEQTAAQREAFYQVFEQTPAGVALLRGPGPRYEYANVAYQQLFPGRQLVGRTVAEAVLEAGEQGFVALLDQVYQTGETYVGQEELAVVAQPDGQPPRDTYFDYTYQAMREAGHIVGVSIFVTDVTERVLARRQRAAQQQQLEELFMQAPNFIVVLDGPDLVFQLVNPAYQQAFPDRALQDRPLLDALPELAETAIPAILRQVYATGEPHTDQELPLRMARHEGDPPEEIFWTFSYLARRDAHSAIDGVRVFAHDVTAPVRARQAAEANRQQVRALNQQQAALNDKLFAANAALADANEGLGHANQQLARTNADLDSFVYAASHDFKTPIANLEGLLYALREELPAPPPPGPSGPADSAGPVQPLLDMMQGAVARFQTTLGQLSDIVQLQGAPAPSAEPVDLTTLVADVCLDLAPLLAAADAQLTTELTSCPSLTFAPRNLRSIVFNLLSNAVKHRHPDRPPAVRIRCRTTGAATVLDVQDNGLGLSPAQQAELFGLFRRFHSHVEGSGVGLYTLKKIVENAGGTITVQSVLDVGSTFTVVLPVPVPS